MKTYNCKKCGLKFKANSKVTGESRRHFYEQVKCPRCGAVIDIVTDKEYESGD